jgi:glycosyltransferase involved in cell wall biosynthesis
MKLPAVHTDSQKTANTGNNIRVCMLCDLYFPLFSGASYIAHHLALDLIKQNYQTFVLASRYPGTTAEEIIDGVSVKRVGIINSSFPFVRALSMAFSLLPALFRYRHHFDILHIHSIKPFDFIPIFFARLLGKKTIIEMMLIGSTDDPSTWPTSHLGIVMQPSFELADRIVSLSGPLADNYRHSSLDASKLRQISPGVDLTRFHPVTEVKKKALREKLGLRGDATYLCFVGSFKHRKGADILVNTFIALSKQYPELCLLVVGPDTFDDPVRIKLPYAAYAEKLKDQLRQAGLAERVVFTGLVQNVEEYLEASDVFMFPSRREGFGAVIIEAMAVGLPCVLAEMDGIAAEISASGKTAVIVSSEAAEQYAQQISNLLSNPESALQMGQLGRQRVVQEYAMQIVTAKHIKLYQELLHPNSRKSPKE